MRIWVVIYQTNLGYVYGWLCKENQISAIEEDFWLAMGDANGKAIKCIAALDSDVIGSLISLYEAEQEAS